ncbi:MAG: NAD-binding protein, partial [bacterium]
GMLLDVGFLLSHPLMVFGASLGVMILKATLAGGIALILGYSLRTAILAGLAIGQIGEFSFILASMAHGEGLIGSTTYQMLLAMSIFTMAATPFLIGLSPRFADSLVSAPALGRLAARKPHKEIASVSHRDDHLVVVGFGVNGRNVARAAEFAAIPYVVIEMNPETVRAERKSGRPVIYGDATQEAVLESAHVSRARIVVIAINDPSATRRVTQAVRRLSPAAHLIVRTRFLQEIPSLQALGANDVIPEEFETSVEIFTRVLSKYLVPRQDVEKLVDQIRSANYVMLRNLPKHTPATRDLGLYLAGADIVSMRVEAGAQIVGKSLGELGLRTRYGVTVLAVRRGEDVLSNPHGDFAVQADDILILLGDTESVGKVAKIVDVIEQVREE